MPTIKDLTPGVIFEGNEGERWVVQDGVASADRINVELVKLEVKEIIDPISREEREYYEKI